jgi:hypothetical protein
MRVSAALAGCLAALAPLVNAGAEDAACEVEGRPADRVLAFVSAREEPIYVSDTLLRVALTAGHRQTVRANAPLAFTAIVETRNLPLQPRRPLLLEQGILRIAGLYPGDATVVDVTAGSTKLDLRLEWGGPLGVLPGVSIPCADLSLDPPPPLPNSPTRAIGWYRLRPGPLAVRARVASEDVVHFTVATTAAESGPAEALEETATEVKIAFGGWGVRLTGWVPRAQLVATTKPKGRYGRGAGSVLCHVPEPRGHFQYTGTAWLAVGTEVFDRPGGEPWIRVTTGLHAEVRRIAGSEWAQVVRIPGLSGACPNEARGGRLLEGAYVRWPTTARQKPAP